MSPRPGRASVLTAEHVEVVKRLRAANPGVGMGSLRQLVAQACGLDEPPSQSALHRFMQRHAIRRGAYQDLPTEKAAQDLVCRALEIARGVVYDPAATADEHRGAFCQNLGNAFAHLVTLWAHEAGVRGVDTDLARAWLRDAGVAIAGRPAGSSGRGGAGSGLVQQRWCP